jgi:hypothetical protein
MHKNTTTFIFISNTHTHTHTHVTLFTYTLAAQHQNTHHTLTKISHLSLIAQSTHTHILFHLLFLSPIFHLLTLKPLLPFTGRIQTAAQHPLSFLFFNTHTTLYISNSRLHIYLYIHKLTYIYIRTYINTIINKVIPVIYLPNKNMNEDPYLLASYSIDQNSLKPLQKQSTPKREMLSKNSSVFGFEKTGVVLWF